MKAFLLSAGKGERLLPFTKSKPKSLVEVGGRPLIQWNIEKLKQSGIDKFVINLFYKGNQIEDFLGDGSLWGVEIIYSYESNLLGTGGGIGKTLGIIGTEPFLLISSDIWTDFNFKNLSLGSQVLAHLVLVENSIRKPKGDMFLDGNQIKLQGPGKNLTFSGLAILDPELFKNITKKKYGIWEEILLPAIEKGLVTGELYKGLLLNINTKEDLEKLDSYLADE